MEDAIRMVVDELSSGWIHQLTPHAAAGLWLPWSCKFLPVLWMGILGLVRQCSWWLVNVFVVGGLACLVLGGIACLSARGLACFRLRRAHGCPRPWLLSLPGVLIRLSVVVPVLVLATWLKAYVEGLLHEVVRVLLFCRRLWCLRGGVGNWLHLL